MIYIYDILLNWNKEKLYDFYEWEKTDQLEHIRRIPLYKVKKEVINDMLNYNIKIDKEFIKRVYNLTESYTSKKVNKINYGLIVCDESRTLAIKIDKQGNIKYRSNLLLDEEEEVISLSNKLSVFEIKYEKKDKILKVSFNTRKEERIKEYLLLEIENCYKNKNYDKLKYLYKEYGIDIECSPKLIYNELKSSLENEINEKHKNMYSLLQMITNKN